MKLIIVLMLAISIQAQAEDKKKPFISIDFKAFPKEFKEMGEDLNAVATDFFKPELINCSPKKEDLISKSILQATKDTALITSIKKEVYANIEQQFNVNTSKKTERSFYKILSCINKRFQGNRVSYKCTNAKICDGFPAAFVRGYDTVLGFTFNTAIVNICNNSLDKRLSSNAEEVDEVKNLSELLIHEVAHTCATVDHQYHQHLDDEVFSYPGWHRNADAYSNIISNMSSIYHENSEK